MYCIECGKQIPEKSKFCQHCGSSQDEMEITLKEKIAEVIIENEITRQIIEEEQSSINYQFLRQAMGWYLTWILLHLAFLLIFSDGIFDGDNSHDGFDDFWPFNWKSRLRDYDITEFLVYTIFPLAILIIISLTKKPKKKTIE